jgi:hypothetical protein
VSERSPCWLFSRCSSNDGTSPSLSGTHRPSTPAKSAKIKKQTERDRRTVTTYIKKLLFFFYLSLILVGPCFSHSLTAFAAIKTLFSLVGKLRFAASKNIYTYKQRVTEISALILTGNRTHQKKQLFSAILAKNVA